MSTGVPDEDRFAADRLAAVEEELLIAGDELRAQQELIAELIRARSDERVPLSDLLAPVPVPVLDTDRTGKVLVANAAAGRLFGVDLAILTGKPVQAFVMPSDRPEVRSALSDVVAGGRSRHLRVRLLPRRAEPVTAEVVIVSASGPAVPATPTVSADQDTARPAAGSRRPDRSVPARWVVAPLGDPMTVPVTDPAADAADGMHALAELAGLSVARTSLRAALQRIAGLAVGGVPGADAGSISVGPPEDPEHLVATEAWAQSADGAQHRAGQGPSWTAYASRAIVAAERIGDDPRWPRLHSAALTGSALAVPLTDGSDVVGVLTLYGQERLTGRVAADRAAMFAGGAAAVLHEHTVIAGLRAAEQQLREAMATRSLIGQATGIVMAALGCGPEEAFAVLVRDSQHRNVKVRQVAAELVERSTAAHIH